jgi:methanogenic corrinoid protein MtbC1
VLVNTARKEVINEEEMVELMEARPDFKYLTDILPGNHEEMMQKFPSRYFSTPKKMGAQTSEANINAGIAAARQIVDFFQKGTQRFRMKLSTFLLYTTLGAGIWNAILAAIGYYLASVPGIETEEQLIAKVTEYSHELGYLFIAIAIFIVGYLVYKGYKSNNK